jgi:hypothetical protein
MLVEWVSMAIHHHTKGHMTVEEYYSSEQNWCKHSLHNHQGQRCLVGATYHCYKKEDRDAVMRKLETAIRTYQGMGYSITAFNDSATTSFKDVLAVVKAAQV